MNILKTTLHPERDKNTDLYPKTSPDQIVGLVEYLKEQGGLGSGIKNISVTDVHTVENKTLNTITVMYDDNSTQTFTVECTNGERGETGANGTQINNIAVTNVNNDGNKTLNTITVTYDDNSTQTFIVECANGEKGETGAQGFTGTGISHITEGSPYISGNKTITPLSFEYSDGSTQALSAYAENGVNIYTKKFTISNSPDGEAIYIIYDGTDFRLSADESFTFILMPNTPMIIYGIDVNDNYIKTRIKMAMNGGRSAAGIYVENNMPIFFTDIPHNYNKTYGDKVMIFTFDDDVTLSVEAIIG